MALRLLFFGTPDFAATSLRALLRTDHKILAVITNPDRVQGRGRKLAEPAVKTVAQEAGLPVLQPVHVNAEEALREILRVTVDVSVVVAYGQILRREILQHPTRGCINVHASLLPRWRGAAPIQAAVCAGDRVTGVTTMFLNERMDAGDLLLTRETPIGPDETAGELFDRLAPLGADLLVDTLAAIEAGTVAPCPQDENLVTYAPMLRHEDGRIDWSRPAAELHNHVRGMSPWPGAYTFCQGIRLQVWRCRALPDHNSNMSPGQVMAISDAGPLVATAFGTLQLLELQSPGRRRLSGADWLRGARLRVGEMLESAGHDDSQG